MLAAYDSLPEVAAAYAEAGAILNCDLAAAADTGAGLDDTAIVQPAMVAAGVGAYRAWRALGGPEPAAVAGHSVGEYAALVAGEAISFAAAIDLVSQRAKAMRAAVPPGEGAMAAVLGLTAEQTQACCADVGEAWIANLNGKLQTVITGKADAVASAAEACRRAGAKRVVLLKVAVPSHCPLMEPAAQALAEPLRLAPLRTPRIPVIHNAGNCSASDPDAIRDALKNQLCAQVDWPGAVAALAKHADELIECGPGKVLHNLNRRIAPDKARAALADTASIRELTAGEQQ